MAADRRRISLLLLYERVNGNKVPLSSIRRRCSPTSRQARNSRGAHPNTVLRDWRLAKAWLGREMGKSEAGDTNEA